VELWRKDDLVKKAVQSKPEECFREGYDLVIPDEGSYKSLKDKTVRRAQDLRVDDHIQRAMNIERALGGAAVLIGANDGPLDTVMIPEKVKSIDWLTTLEPIELYPVQYYEDPTAPKYGEPMLYQLATQGWNGANTLVDGNRAPPPTDKYIHESRLIIFQGIRVSRYQRYDGVLGSMWGDSILGYVVEAIRDFNIACASAGILVTDFSQPIFTMPGLKETVMREPEKLRARMAALELGRSVARAILLDDKETFVRQTTSLTGLAELLDRLASRLASAIEMPITLLMGNSPKGLGNEGESDVRFYYDRIASFQRRHLAPHLRTIYQLIMQSIGGKVPDQWEIKFNPLWQLTEQERADARLTQARADGIYLKNGVLREDEVRVSRFAGGYSYETQIDESKPAPGPVIPPGHAPFGQNPMKPQVSAAGAHGVTGYTRRNPAKKAGPGSVAPQADRYDDAELDEMLMVAQSEWRNAVDSRARLNASGGITPAVDALLNTIERTALEEMAWIEEQRVNQEQPL
jgi:phage-related protein (TIGR01555 family)